MNIRHLLVLAMASTPSLSAMADEPPAPEAVATVSVAQAMPSPPPADQEPAPAETREEIVVTARKREERLQDVPVSVTAISGQQLEEKQINQAKDIAAITPSLNITSDSVSRSFIDIRGVGTTLIDTVQPGVGIFIDGVYEPNTSYLNSPLVDVARIEVLRGPQGTLFGQNTLGGAINIITKQPTDEFTAKVTGSYADGDRYKNGSVSMSGPIVDGVLRMRIGAAYQDQDGFLYNTLSGGDANPLNQKTVNGTLVFEPADGMKFSLNGYFNRVFGGNVPYAVVDGPTDYNRHVTNNQNPLTTIFYRGGNLKSEFDVEPLSTGITLVTAYDTMSRSGYGDGDFGPDDLFRTLSNTSTFHTWTGELRLDTHYSDALSSLFGVFADRNINKGDAVAAVTLVPGVPVPVTAHARVGTDVYAVYGTLFWNVTDTIEATAGLRYDHQKVVATGDIAGTISASEFEPRVTLAKKWRDDVMTYASISRGFRGGGANQPGAPNPTYRGDSVWTYEVGAKLSIFEQRLTLETAIFYNDYRHYIGQNGLKPAPNGVGAIAVNLNTGTVHSPGIEGQLNAVLTPHWTANIGGSYLHARVVDGSDYEETIGEPIATDHILFLSDWSGHAGTAYSFDLFGNRLIADTGVTYKGKRTGSTTDPDSIPWLRGYALVNASLTWRTPHYEIALYGSNLTDEKYFQTYVDKSLVEDALSPLTILFPRTDNNLAIVGDGRRVGMRVGLYF